MGLLKKGAGKTGDEGGLPFITVIVPCFNESERILKKITNLRKQDYPQDKIEVIIADGGSEDGTIGIIEKELPQIPYMRLLKCPEKGKINQLNHALPQAKGEIIFNTDVDGEMKKD